MVSHNGEKPPYQEVARVLYRFHPQKLRPSDISEELPGDRNPQMVACVLNGYMDKQGLVSRTGGRGARRYGLTRTGRQIARGL